MRKIKLNKNRFVIMLILFMLCFVFADNSVEALTEEEFLATSYFDYDACTNWAIQEHGIGKDVASIAIDGGLLSEDFWWKGHNEGIGEGDPATDVFSNTFSGNYQYLVSQYMDNKSTLKNKYNDGYYGTVKEMYNSVIAELKATGKFEEYFKYAENPKYYGTYLYKEKMGHLVMMATQIIRQRLDEIEKVHYQGCKDSNTFTYGGKTFSCDKIVNSLEVDDYPRVYGIDASKLGFACIFDTNAHKIGEKVFDPGYQWEGKEKYENELSELFSNYSKRSTNNETTIENVDDLYYFKSSTNYYPSITKIYENSKKLGTQTLNTGDFDTSVENIVKEIVKIISLFGRYIIYASILFLGVRAIFQGASGQADFKEYIPYLVGAIIFFFRAPDLVSVIQNQFSTFNDLEEIATNIFATFIYLVRIASFCGLIVAGLKIIFGGATGKAKIKETLLPIFVGCVFVFSSTVVVEFSTDILKDVSGMEAKKSSSTSMLSTNSDYEVLQ